MNKPNNNLLSTFIKLVNIIDELREKCPWDKKQTMNSLRHLTIDEVYELSDAIIKRDNKNIEDELGDLLFHVIFYSKIGSEKNTFTLSSVIKRISNKLIYRHPHIYSNTSVKDENEVKLNWENLKLKEKARKGVLNGVPQSLPAIIKAMRIQEKAKNVGFDWEKTEQVLEKIEEEIKELKSEIKNRTSPEKIKSELGDVIFSIINYARFLNIDPEEALEITNKKFINRFNHLESEVKKAGKSLNSMTLEEMNLYWNKSKKYK